MQRASALVVGLAGLGLGMLLNHASPNMRAASSDRYQDYVMCTGAVSINPRMQADGVWLLDYRSGKLLGTVIDKSQGKIVGWAEVFLPTEFAVEPKQDVHFMMTTGYISQGQSALYVAETTTGKFGVYTMGPGENGAGIVIRRHDVTSFRTTQPVQPASTTIPGMPGVPATALPGQPAFAPPPAAAPMLPIPQPGALPPLGQPQATVLPPLAPKR